MLLKWDFVKEKHMDGNVRKNIRSGMRVAIVLKQDQSTGRLTDGVVRDILTKSPTHPHGIKVRLLSGEVGRVKEIYA
jgi:uncharacterized repeat protein (TIGR03833 family)